MTFWKVYWASMLAHITIVILSVIPLSLVILLDTIKVSH